MKAEKRGFTQGVVYAIAQLIRLGDTGHAEIIWDESGFSENDLNFCDNYDADKVRGMMFE